jgi:hypothetical protein
MKAPALVGDPGCDERGRHGESDRQHPEAQRQFPW